MKKSNKISNIFLFVALSMIMASCGLDNYEAPQSKLTGKVIYNGQPLGVKGTTGEVYLQLWQYDWQIRTGAINVYVGQDGSFTALLHDGEYYLVMNNNRGPWVNNPDTVHVTVKGNTVADYPVTPYFTISNVSYSLSGTTLTASLDVTEVTPGRTVSTVALIVGKTQFVDNSDQAHTNWVRLTNQTPGRITLTIDVSDDLSKQTQLYARVGLQISGISQWLFDTNVQRIK